MKLTFLIFSILGLASCKSVVGVYGECEKKYYACYQVQIKNNKTFEIFSFFDVGGGTVYRGKWEYLAKDSIELIWEQDLIPEEPIPEIPPLDSIHIPKTYHEESYNSALGDSIRVTIQDWETTLPFATLRINQEENTYNTDFDGTLKFKRDSLSTLIWSFIGYGMDTIKIEDPKSNDIQIFGKDLNIHLTPYKPQRPCYLEIPSLITVHKKENEIVFWSRECHYGIMHLKKVRWYEKRWKSIWYKDR